VSVREGEHETAAGVIKRTSSVVRPKFASPQLESVVPPMGGIIHGVYTVVVFEKL